MGDTMNADVVGAFVKSVDVLDKSRRVGWAKAYEANARLDDALRDVNMFRSDRDVYRRGASFMFGFFCELTDQSKRNRRRILAAFSRYAGVEDLLDEDAINEGREQAIAVLSMDELRADEVKLAFAAQNHEEAKKKRIRKQNQGWRDARIRERRYIAARFGFQSDAAMFSVLQKFMEATGRQPIADPKTVRLTKSVEHDPYIEGQS